MTTSTDGSNESASSENVSTGNLKHSPSTSPGSTAVRTLTQHSWTRKILVVTALVLAVKTGTVLAFGDNAFITTLLELLLQGLEGQITN